MTVKHSKKTALVLSGGGARAAYQVGALKAISRVLPQGHYNPYHIICGTSAGAINAAALATYAKNPELGIKHLERIWRSFHTNHIYRTDLFNLATWFNRFLLNALFGYKSHQPTSILNNEPLWNLLRQVILIDKIQASIDSGSLYALAITCSSYNSGESISFYQGHYSIKNWERHRRLGQRTQLSIEHLMASAAIPGIFPAVAIQGDYFGDGSVRQIAPISPALHMGADRVVVIGVNSFAHQRTETPPDGMPYYPRIVQIFNHLLNSAFLDNIETDVERLKRINLALNNFSDEERTARKLQLKPIDLLELTPTCSLDAIAWEHAQELPWTLRHFFSGSGANEKDGSGLLSYLLFEPGYCRALINQGYNDTMTRKNEISYFFNASRDL